jgi:hypothetical protein
MGRGVLKVLGSADEGAFDRIRRSLNPNWIDEALEATAPRRSAEATAG